LSWLTKISQRYSLYYKDEPCRIIPSDYVPNHKALVEFEDGSRMEIFKSQLKNKPSFPDKKDTPKDILCPLCGQLNETGFCYHCEKA